MNVDCSSKRLNEVAGRFGQKLKEKTIHHIVARWVVFLLLLGTFLLRTLVLLTAFYVVAYALGVYLIAQFDQFLSPLNDLLVARGGGMGMSSSSSATIEVSNGDDNAETDNDRPETHLRRVTEYQLWLGSCKGVVVATMFTLSEWFNIPVFWPILAAYLAGLVLFALGRRFYQRRAASATYAQSSDIDTNTVQIHLVPKPASGAGHFAIAKILPWSATRVLPPFLNKISLIDWRNFLIDLEGCMEIDPMLRRRALTFIGIFFLFLSLCNVAFISLDEYLYHNILYCDNNQHHFQGATSASMACRDHSFWFALMVCFAPPIAYFVIEFKKLMDLQKKEFANCSEKIKQLCEDYLLKYPKMFLYNVKEQRNSIIVELKNPKQQHNDGNDEEAIRNSNSSASDNN